jgi:hypothetical protein
MHFTPQSHVNHFLNSTRRFEQIERLPTYSPEWFQIKHPNVCLYAPSFPRPHAGPAEFSLATAMYHRFCMELGQTEAMTKLRIDGIGWVYIQFCRSPDHGATAIAYRENDPVAKSAKRMCRFAAKYQADWVICGRIRYASEDER